jgi:hypothetical protein
MVKEAFEFNEQFCEAVIESNPPPVTETRNISKFYLGSMMQKKKKYCGMKFESKDQRKHIFEAKRIETTPLHQSTLVQRVLRNALLALF